MWTRKAVVVVLLLAVAVVYGSALGHGFLEWDDRVHTVDNPHITDTTYFFGHFEQGMYMPITFAAWSVLYRLFGADPAPFHGLNLLLHAANTLLVFLLLEQLLRAAPRRISSWMRGAKKSPRRRVPRAVAAGAGALLFALHPLQVEPVAWITSLKDVGYVFFSLLATVAFVHALRRQLPRLHPLHLASVGAFAVATLCKPAAISLLLVLAILCLLWLTVPWRRTLSLLTPFALAALPATLLNTVSQQRLTLLWPAPLHLRPLVALDSLGFYVGKLLLPLHLSPAYERSPRWLIESGTITYGWLGGAVAIGAVLAARRRLPALGASFAIFVAGVLLVLGLKSFAAQDNTTVYDRYAYLAMLGPALLGAVALRRLHRRWQLAAAAALLVALGAKSFAQVRHWRSDRSLWTHALALKPDSAVALVGLGLQESRDGNRARALELYQKAVAAKPHDVEAHNNLGAVLASMGRRAEAERHFVRAVALSPRDVAARNNLSRLAFEAGQLDRAEHHVRQVLERAPHHRDANLRLGEILLARGQLDACIDHMEGVVRWREGDPDALTLLGVALARRGEVEPAIEYFQAALRVDPDHRAARQNLDVALGETSPPQGPSP